MNQFLALSSSSLDSSLRTGEQQIHTNSMSIIGLLYLYHPIHKMGQQVLRRMIPTWTWYTCRNAALLAAMATSPLGSATSNCPADSSAIASSPVVNFSQIFQHPEKCYGYISMASYIIISHHIFLGFGSSSNPNSKTSMYINLKH